MKQYTHKTVHEMETKFEIKVPNTNVVITITGYGDGYAPANAEATYDAINKYVMPLVREYYNPSLWASYIAFEEQGGVEVERDDNGRIIYGESFNKRLRQITNH